MAAKTQGNKPENSGRTTIIICVAAVIIVALLAVILVLVLRGPTQAAPQQQLIPADEPNKRPTVVTRENAEQVAEELFRDDEPDDSIPQSYTVSMNSTWNFKTGTSPSYNASVTNSRDNTTPVYFDVVRNDTGETIYASPVIPVGEHLGDFALDVDLDPGTYECTMIYHLIDDDQNTLTTVNMWVEVIVEG